MGKQDQHENRRRRSGISSAKKAVYRGQDAGRRAGHVRVRSRDGGPGCRSGSRCSRGRAIATLIALQFMGTKRRSALRWKRVMGSGIKREELWITSKLWNDKHGEEDVIASCRKSLADLRLDYLDLYLVHWPFPNFHPPHCDVTSRSPDAKPYIHENYMKTWRKMEELVDMGLVRHIGTSNMTVPKLKLVLRDARIKPAVNEMELHPHFQQPELFKFVVDNGIAADRLLPDWIAGPPGAGPHAGRYDADARSGDCGNCQAPRHQSRSWCASSGRCSAGKRRFRFQSITITKILPAWPPIR